MLVHIKSIISRANKGGFAVGAFNTSNLEVTLGIIRGAVKKKSPVIVQLSEATIAYAGLSNIFALIKIIAETDGKNIPIAVHLDHGKSQEIIEACVRAGLSSVHRDGSALSFEENIKVTKKAVIFAHRHGVFCQGELGAMLGHEGLTKITVPKNHDLYMTDPKLAAEFVKRTGVDTLAISVGTLHGNFVGIERIDFARFINKAVITEEIENFKPEHTFQDFAVDERLKKAVIAHGYKEPTPIQDRTIPHIIKGCDLVGVANTGTGKTAAFLVPLINKVLLNSKELVLIIVPTRELAIQIDQELKAFVRGMKIFSPSVTARWWKPFIRPQFAVIGLF